MPSTAEAPARHLDRSKAKESPRLGPVGTSVRSSLQGGTSVVRLHLVQGGQQAGVPGQGPEEVGLGGLGTGPGERCHGRFGASLPELWFNQSRGREQRKGWSVSSPGKGALVCLAVPICKVSWR